MVTTRPTAIPEQDLLAEQRLGRDEAAGEPREGVLLALQGQRPGHQQYRDEGQGEGRGDGDREGFQWRRVEPPTADLVDFDRLREAFDQRPGDVEVFARLVGEFGHLGERQPRSGAARQRRFDRFEDLGAGVEAEDVDRPGRARQVAALDHQVEVLAAFDRDPLARSPDWPGRAAR